MPDQPTTFVAPLAESDDLDALIDEDGRIVDSPANDPEGDDE